MTGKYTALRDAYASIIKAIEHCSIKLGVGVNVRWIDSTGITDENVARRLGGVDGIIVPGGFGVRGTEGKVACVKFARENKVPYLGLCLGFQMAVLEYARNVCGISDACSTEFVPDCAEPVISVLPEQKKIEGLGGNMRLGAQDVDVVPGTFAAELFDHAKRVRLRFRHRYEVDPKYIPTLEEHGMIFSGRHPKQPIMQVLELPRDGRGGPPVLRRHAGAPGADQPPAAAVAAVFGADRRRARPRVAAGRRVADRGAGGGRGVIRSRK